MAISTKPDSAGNNWIREVNASLRRSWRAVVHLAPLLAHAVCHPVWALRAARRGLRVCRADGISALKQRLLLRRAIMDAPRNTTADMSYKAWIERYASPDTVARKRRVARVEKLARRPLISVLMPVYNPPPALLDEAIWSVRRQLYPVWELCIADDASSDPAVREVLERHRGADCRIHVVFRDQNGHISRASNAALDLAQGEFIALLDHDDMLSEDALFHVAEAIEVTPGVGLLYSDEDKLDTSGERYDPYFKCELNYELLLAQNMICHLGVYRTAVVRALGGFRTGFEGAQDYDLALRVIEQLTPKQVVHIPRVLYHWRAISGSTALSEGEKNYAAEAGRRAVQDHLDRTGLEGRVVAAPESPALNRVVLARLQNPPLVSIIIPTRDRVDLLKMCIDSILERSTYPNYEIVVVDNGSAEEATFGYLQSLPAKHVRVLRDDGEFNFSRINNEGARFSRGELLCLMNNDIEILTPDWLEEMVSFALRPDVGCVGARLWYPDGRLQHGGVIIGLGGVAGHSHKYIPRGHPGYFYRAVLHQSLSAVTAACLLIRREVFDKVSGLDESLAVAFNDVDFCLRVREAGFRNVWTPYAEMNHHESASRGYEDNPEKQARFARECSVIQSRWGELLMEDPAYSPNLTLASEDFAIAWPPRVRETVQ